MTKAGTALWGIFSCYPSLGDDDESADDHENDKLNHNGSYG